MANKSKATIYDPNDITKTTLKETKHSWHSYKTYC
jgi:hypothetical protein